MTSDVAVGGKKFTPKRTPTTTTSDVVTELHFRKKNTNIKKRH